ncbi:putative transcriptional regulator [Pseudomonas sp. MT-1]|uniref:hypothetical protein n=1 Tax=Stutzerimonas stutzeri TaxID=316 RepID=UPI000535F8F3|nr:hypothetical protein [Stutzerimonas stutzeri]MCQ4282582.1 hypothetical protein [Stutzerimonas stutzeri]BAP80933.1 putative transcriptional regulator [Pseudomonas sp. MT-1]
MDCSTCTNRCDNMIHSSDLAKSGVRQENVRKLKIAKLDASPAMPFDAEILLDCEDKGLRQGEAFIIDMDGELHFCHATDLPNGALQLLAAYPPHHIETLSAHDRGKARVIGRAFSVAWLTG